MMSISTKNKGSHVSEWGHQQCAPESRIRSTFQVWKRRLASPNSTPALTGLLIVASLSVGWSFNSQRSNFPVTKATYIQEPVASPVSDRTEIVKDWAKPAVTLFISGRQHGYIEPCGCTGLENQKGGLMRRADCQEILRTRGWDLVSLDAGCQIRRTVVQSNLKLQATYETLVKVMRYDVIGFGIDELKLPGLTLMQTLLNNVEENNIFVSSNVQFKELDFTVPYRVLECNGKKIGVTTILSDDFVDQVDSAIKLTPPKEALNRVVQSLKNENCDVKILLAQAPREQCLQFANLFPFFDFIVVGDCVGEPTGLPEKVVKGTHVTQIIETGDKGMYVGLIGCYWDNGKLETKYQFIPMDARFQDHPAAKEIFVSYQKNLEQRYRDQANFPDIFPARKTLTGYKFVGSQACEDCHEDEYDIWLNGVDGNGGPHAKATKDLVDPENNPRAEINRSFDPECLSCHVTGWNPQNMFPYETGYADFVKDSVLHGNGCENCHGPGGEHADAENGSADEATIDRLRGAMARTLQQAKQEMCIECHDSDNSPDSAKKGFEEYWEKIKH